MVFSNQDVMQETYCRRARSIFVDVGMFLDKRVIGDGRGKPK